MKTREYTESTGKIKPFNLQEELRTVVKLDDSKPSKRIMYNKKNKAAMVVLDDIEKNHNTSWYRELRSRAEKNMNAILFFIQ